MDANIFIAKLKSDEKDSGDLVKVFNEYKAISAILPTKDKGPFAVNVLCVICRNLDKLPTWKNGIDNQKLLGLSIDCIRETRVLDRGDRMKTLACIYHIHRYAVRLNKPIQPELILKVSFMPFELESKHLLQEYYKTYWNILADRFTYYERLKTKSNIIKLLPKLTEDIIKVIDIYNTVQFCSNILIFVIKKLHLLYNEAHAKELSQTFVEIFKRLATKDLKTLKNLTEKEILEIYIKLNECLYVVAENASKVDFKDGNLDIIIRSCMSLVGHNPDLFHCLQTFHLNSFSSILTYNTNLTCTESVLKNLLTSCQMTEKLGYEQAMYATYPFLNQFLRLYIEYNVTNSTRRPWEDHFDVNIQDNCLKLILMFMTKLKDCDQLLKCEHCAVSSGLHDSLRLSFLTKHFITVPLQQNLEISDILPIFYSIITEQYSILTELNQLGCVNYLKCFRKLQTDVHNTAISLNKALHFDYSIKLFEIYLQHELIHLTTETEEIDYKNITRAFYNKSICELDCKLYEKAVIDAFLSLVFSQEEGFKTDKYMNLVMDIKAKELKARGEETEEPETFQVISVLDACQKAVDSKLYGDLTWFMSRLKFSELLKQEFKMYARVWPSIAPVGGVWRSLLQLSKTKHYWIQEETEEAVLGALYEVILQTPSAVRTIHSEYFTEVVKEILNKFQENTPEYKKLSADLKLVHVVLLFLQFEYDMAEASEKYGWKSKEQCVETETTWCARTLPQEYGACCRATRALRLLCDISQHFTTVPGSSLQPAVQLLETFVPQLFQLGREPDALQLAYMCCCIADIVHDDVIYIRNAGFIISNVSTASAALDRIIDRATHKCGHTDKHTDTTIMYICDLAIHFANTSSVGVAARLVQLAEASLLRARHDAPDLDLDLAMGRVLEAQVSLTSPSLTTLNNLQRHYFAICGTGSRHTVRKRTRSLIHQLRARSSVCVTSLSRSVMPRRAAAAAAVTSPTAADILRLTAELVDTTALEDAQVKIDRLKHTLGLQPTQEAPHIPTTHPKLPHFTPKQDIELMVDNMLFKKTTTSPSLPCVSVPAFKMPDFFSHNKNCSCYACAMPICYVIACKIAALEASMYFRSNEKDIARNYFDGALAMIDITETKLNETKKTNHEEFIAKSTLKKHKNDFRKVKVELLIELAFYELKYANYDEVDDHIVTIHEVMKEMDADVRYLSEEVTNLIIAAATLKKTIKKPTECGLEIEFDSLKLSPDENPPQTPVGKGVIPEMTKLVVKDEEIPKRRKVIKLNLDESPEEKDFEKPKVKKEDFKVPTSKPLMEMATPMPKQKPKVILTQPSYEIATPVNETTADFHTPYETPERFFTPMTSIKTYAKKSLRQNIVKNLEHEFSTPKNVDKENASVSSVRARRRDIKRATSPGKVSTEVKDGRPRRVRRPVKNED